jgi:ribonucleoside-diphosphate reductase alpha chain
MDYYISVTINLENDATGKSVSELYLKAWESCYKGVVVYRGGLRSGVLISMDEKKEDKAKRVFPKKKAFWNIKANLVCFQNQKEKWISLVGLFDKRFDKFFIGFTVDEDGVLILCWAEKELVIKKRNEDGTVLYDFQYQNKRGYKRL